MDSVDYDARADKLQADLEEQSPLLAWRVYRAAEAIDISKSVPEQEKLGPEQEIFGIKVDIHINGRSRINYYHMDLEGLDDEEYDAVKEILLKVGGFLTRLIMNKEAMKWTVPSAVKDTA